MNPEVQKLLDLVWPLLKPVVEAGEQALVQEVLAELQKLVAPTGATS